ncbi:MAG: thioredoxin family protein, partial [Pararhodobacter sp.]
MAKFPTLLLRRLSAHQSRSICVASMGLSIDEQKAVERFRTEVVEPSQTSLVILDFWAEWCGPCKALTPVLEKIAAEYADKGVVLAKINVDEEQFIAAQFQVRSIPTVYAMFQGQPVADLTNARSESQLRGLLDQLLAQLPISAGEGLAEADPHQPSAEQLAQYLSMAEAALSEGDAQRAGGIFAQ